MGMSVGWPNKAASWIFRSSLTIPFFYYTYLAFTQDLGAQPAETLNRRLGTVAIRLLLFNLYLGVAIAWIRPFPTSLRWLGGQRRFLGWACYFYLLLHISFHFVKEGNFFPAAIELFKYPYLVAGFAAFLILTVLAVTSNNRSARRLTYGCWKKIHRYVYLAIPILAVHLLLIEKRDLQDALLYVVPIAVLELIRYWRYRRDRSASLAGAVRKI